MQQLSKFGKTDKEIVRKALGLSDGIPDEWEVCRQGDICDFINGYAYSMTEFRKTGYPIIRIQNLNGGDNYVYSDLNLPEKQFAKEGDLLFAWSATFGPYIWIGPKASYHYHIWKLNLNEEVDKKFVYYHLERISERIKIRGQSGLGMVHMTKNGMERYPFLKPPLKEQQKIASILSNEDELIQKAEQIIEHTQKLKESLTQKLMTKGIGHTNFKKTTIGEIPEEWKMNSINNMSTLVTIGVVNTATPYYTKEKDGIPYFRTQNIRRNYMNKSNLVYVTKEFNQKHKKSILKENDILTVQTGEIGASCLVPKEYEGCNCHSIILTRTNPQKLNYQYLCQFLNSNFGKKVISKFSLNTGRGHLLLEDYRTLEIPEPPISEQQKIASILSNIDKLIQKQILHKEQIQQIKKGLMQQLLTGKIRVKV